MKTKLNLAKPTNAGSAGRLSRRALGLTAGMGAAAALAACGAKKGATSSKSAPAGQTAKPKYGGALNVAIPSDFFDYDSSLGGKTSPNSTAIELVYSRLLSVKQGAGVDYNATILQSDLAQKWETPDAQTFTFHLRNGVKFADLAPVNGRALTSDDVKWSFEYWSRTGQFGNKRLPRGQFEYVFDGLDRIEAPDPSTVVGRFKQPFAPFLAYTALHGVSIVPHEIFDADGSLSKRAAGSGPFMLDTAGSQRGARWVFKKNPSYWDSTRPYLDQINCLVINDDATMYAAFQAKQLDIVPRTGGRIDTRVEDQVKKNNPDALVQEYDSPITESLFITWRRPPFNDLRVRKAFSMAIDRDEFDRTFARGKGTWVMCMASLPNDFTQAEIHQVLKYDPEQAKQLVAQAGYANGATAEYLVRQGDIPLPEVELLQSQAKKANFNLTIKTVDKATGSKRLHSGDFDLVRGGSAIDGDTDALLVTFYGPSSNNYIGIKDPKLDALIEAERREPDPAKRHERIRDVERYMGENAVSVSLFRPNGATFWHPYLKNYADNWMQHEWNAANVWLEK